MNEERNRRISDHPTPVVSQWRCQLADGGKINGIEQELNPLQVTNLRTKLNLGESIETTGLSWKHD
ncbi:MAG: hypothetical protein CBD74_08425 [Saprospirales bacterium TMED214]|nr:MAG: hypothetical protein CBD74_08425 [Saprospirales bacterium TMED214]